MCVRLAARSTSGLSLTDICRVRRQLSASGNALMIYGLEPECASHGGKRNPVIVKKRIAQSKGHPQTVKAQPSSPTVTRPLRALVQRVSIPPSRNPNRRRNRTADVEYSNLVNSMHAKRRHRFCGGKIVSIYFLAAWRNKYFYMKPLRDRTGRLPRRNASVKGARAERSAAVTPPWLASASRFRLR